MARRRTRMLVPAVLLVACVSGCTADDADSARPSAPSAPETSSSSPPDSPREPRTITTGLDAPWSIAFVDGVALVSERDSGRILELSLDGEAREVGVVPGVTPMGEGGLLGLAVDDERRLYAYSTASGGNRIQRFALTGEPGSLALGGAETILDGLPSAGNHNGGRLAFGPDGMLYATVGDAADRALAQDPASLGGKILRMTPDGDPLDDNPFPGSLVYSLGHRNVQGLAWAEDGTMFATEFGQDTWDELNVIEPGANYGWPEVEGAGGEGFVDPLLQWRPADASPSGMAIVDGVILIANLRGERVRALTVARPETSAELHPGELGRLRDVAIAPDGAVWVLTNNTDGRGSPRDGDDRIVEITLPAG